MEWDDLTEEEKNKVIALIQENYPEFFLKIIDILSPITEAFIPLIETIADVFKNIIEYIMKYIPPEIIEEIINNG